MWDKKISQEFVEEQANQQHSSNKGTIIFMDKAVKTEKAFLYSSHLSGCVNAAVLHWLCRSVTKTEEFIRGTKYTQKNRQLSSVHGGGGVCGGIDIFMLCNV